MVLIKKRHYQGVIIAALLAAFAACSIDKKVFTEGTDELSVLPEGGDTYFIAEVARIRPIIDALSLQSLSAAGDFLSQTDKAVVAFYPKGAPRRFLAAAEGSYPNFWGNLYFFFSFAWKKLSSASGESYYHSKEDALSVFLQSTCLFLSDGDPLPVGKSVSSPPWFKDYRAGAVLAGWMEEPAPKLKRFLDAMEIPLEIPAKQLLIVFYESPAAKSSQQKQYEIHIRLELPTRSQARAIKTLFSMARTNILEAEEDAPYETAEDAQFMFIMKSLFDGVPQQSETAIDLRPKTMDAANIALLFNMFSLYSDEKGDF
ncbi:hypothetical protein ACYULU_00185 [Breznakiellaceae bacterium SP9]